MVFKEYEYVFTEMAEADIDEENEHIIVLRVVFSRRNQETISKTL